MIELMNIRKTYYGKDIETNVLKGVNLTVDSGEFVCIYGSSGSGKSTLGLMLAGLERPTSGEIFFEEKTLAMPYRGMVRRKIQILFQHPEIFSRVIIK